MKNIKKLIALMLTAAMCMGLTVPAMAANSKGVTYSAELNKATVNVSDSDQTVIMTVTGDKEFATYSIGMTVVVPDGWSVVSAANANVGSDFEYNAGTQKIVGAADGDVNGKLVAVIEYKIPANTPAGDYELGIEDLEITENWGDVWEEGGAASVTLTVKPTPNAAKSVALNKTTLELAASSSEQLVATVTGKNANLPCTDEVVWTSNKEAVATVDEEGNVTAVSVGTATITATAGGKKATCKVTVTCPHFNTTDYEAVDSTCTVQGNGEYTACDDCGTVLSGSDAKLPLDEDNHVGETYKDGAVEPTCSEPGNEDHTYCADCDEIITAGAEIPATNNHTDKDGKWNTDGTKHWHVCKCGAKFDENTHSGGTATCKDKAVCETCNVAYGTVDKTNHTGGTYEKGYDAPSCKDNGKENSIYCAGCDALLTEGAVIPATGAHVDKDDKWNTDGTNHWHVCKCGVKFDVATHEVGENGTAATCKDKAVCGICEKTFGEKDATNHTGGTYEKDAVTPTCKEAGKEADIYCSGCKSLLTTGAEIPATGNHIDKNGKFEYDTVNHWETCGCGEAFNVTAHTLEETVEKSYLKSAATCQSAAVYYKSCACGFVSEETFTSGDADPEAHKWDKGVVTLEPTEETEGTKLFTCELCDETKEEILPVKSGKPSITPANPEAAEPFGDVDKSDWFYNDVVYVYENGLMNGTGAEAFSPEMTTDRAMIVTVLWRLEGSPVVDSAVNFSDVADGQWYSDAIDWASANGIVNGYGNGMFGPTDQITREQVMLILNRYAAYKGWTEDVAVTMVAQYTCSIWAENGVNWADLNGLLADLGVNVSDMTAKASRAELAAYLSRFMQNIAK